MLIKFPFLILTGYRVIDYNNGEPPIGFSYVHETMRKGHRVSSAKAFLRPAKNRDNLHISTQTRVTKVLIDPNTKTAYGVEYVKNRRTYIVRARKEVILSAGALNSPQLLMLSGIKIKSITEAFPLYFKGNDERDRKFVSDVL